MRALVAFVLVTGAAATAGAYPQFQLSMDANRCSSCHYSPTGGGLINGYGREKAGDSISQWGGDGGFLHGAWQPPGWLSLGGDLRGAGLLNQLGGKAGLEHELIPMQMDLYGRVEVGKLSLNLIGGLRGTAGRIALDQPSFGSRLFSREHYLMYRQGAEGFYVRAGRYFAPYGLRLAEHVTYVRRFLGFNTLEETYNLTVGYFGERWELHATGFTPDFWRDHLGERGNGGALYFERREGDSFIWGAEAKVVAGDLSTRAMGGLVAKKWFAGPRLLVLAEADLAHQTFDDFDHPRWQFAGYLGGAWFPFRGLMVQLGLERWDEDMGLAGVARDAADVEVQWFPYAHFEVGLFTRYQLLGSGTDDGMGTEIALLQLHYYL